METVLKAISDWIKSLLTAAIMSNLSGLFDDVNTQVGNIAQQTFIADTKFMWTSTLILHSIWRIAMNLLADKRKNTADFDLKSTVFVTLI